MTKALFPTYYTFSQPILFHQNGSDTTVSQTKMTSVGQPFPHAYKIPFLYGETFPPFASFQVFVRNNEKTRIRPQPMTKLSTKPEIMGTRTGYVIRFTCPECAFENLIVNKTPRDHFKETRDASCTHCRKRSTILTPNGPMRKELPVPVSSGISPVL